MSVAFLRPAHLWKGFILNKLYLLASGAAIALAAVPASAATVTFPDTGPNPGGVIELNPAGPGELGGVLGFDVSGTGDFLATLTFFNPFDVATAGGSAVFSFDGDIITFTQGDIAGGGTVAIGSTALGSSIQIDRSNLAGGQQTINIRGTLNPSGNGFARIGGQFNLLQAAAVPEPATWAMFILGFGALGLGMRRRNAAVTATKAKLKFA